MKPTPKPKTVARRMWADDRNLPGMPIVCYLAPPPRKTGFHEEVLLDLRPEATARAVEAMAKAIFEAPQPQAKTGMEYCMYEARAALEALCGKIPK